MSLLDDVSIVVTPNGYKAGELYGVIPVPTEGSELVTNGDFSSGTTGWTEVGDFAISGGKASITSASQYSQLTSQQGTNFLTSGKQYKLQVDIETLSISGVFAYRVTGGAVTPILTSDLVGGVYTTYFTMISDGYIWFQTTGSYTGLNVTIDNVSVKEYTSADMDVTRATAGTRVDENGLVNYAEIIGGEEVTGFTNGTTYPFSTFTTSGNNITSAIISSSFAGAVSNSISIVNGKTYKVTFTYTKNSGDDLRVLISNAISGASVSISNIEQVSASGDITLFLTATSTATGYLQMGTGSGSDSLDISITNISVKEVTRDNVPRIDYTGGGCPHILAEPQRTNLLTYSEDFSNASWQNSSVGTTPVLTSGFTSPDGTNNAYKISNSNQNSFWYWNSSSIGASDARSIYARTVSGTGTAQLLSHNTNTNNTFNLTEEWQRFEVSTTTSGIGNTSYYAVDFRGGGTLDELLIWGAQAEVGSYPTSYIPTSGSTVTRNQDIFTRDGIGSLINSTEGVLFLEMAALADDGTNRYISISSSTTPSDDYIYFRFMSTSNRVLCRTRVGGSTINTIEKTITDTTDYNKYAIKWKSGDYAFWINGVEVGTDTNSTIFGADVLNQIRFDFPVGSGTFPSKVKQLQVYNTALTDEQLLQLTGTSGTDFYESYAEMASALTYTIQ
jgi:hypothetical protein